MQRERCVIRHLESGQLPAIGHNINQFLGVLGEPTRILIRGRDGSRCRMLVTLLHGNEPSGTKALQQLLLEGFEPAVNVYCYLIALEAASLVPALSHRQVPGKRDYNRCFRPPFDLDDQGRVCQQLLDEIRALSPECVVDMHNTSGAGPSFGVTTRYDARHDEIVSLFTDRLVVTDLRLGALMEAGNDRIPVVTIECGGAFEPVADRMALEGLRRYFTAETLLRAEKRDYGLELYFNPMRIEMHQASSLNYGESHVTGSDITLLKDIEHHNFGLVTPQTPLGWIAPGVMDRLGAFDTRRQNHFKELYRAEGGRLYPRRNQKLFMITSSPEIARSDCLWYTALAE